MAIFALLAASGAGASVYLWLELGKREYQAARLQEELNKAKLEHGKTRETVEQLRAQAAALDTQLGQAKSRSTAVETRSSQLNRELSATRASLTEREQREVALMAEIESLRQQMSSAQAPTSVPVSSSAPEAPPQPPAPIDVTRYERKIATLEGQLTELLTRALAEPAIASPETATEPAEAPPYRVVRVGPADAFVVLDYGREQGAAPGDTATLVRGTSELARVQITDARARFSIAHVIPSPRKGQLQAGDIVLLAK